MKVIYLLINLLFLNRSIYSLTNNRVLEYKYQNQHKIKHVYYAFKDSYNTISIKTSPVKNLNIEPYSNWLAKAVWIGNNYNQTGYVLK